MRNGDILRQKAKRLWKALLDLTFPRTCLRCGRLLSGPDEVFTCPFCRQGYHWIGEPLCDRCGTPFHGSVASPATCQDCRSRPPVFQQARSLFLYGGTGARLIHSLKYEGGVWLRLEITALMKASSHWPAYFADSALIPVPLHPSRMRARGYNQAEIIARALHAAFPSTVLLPSLERIRDTPSQTFLNREERLGNMRRAFSCMADLPDRRLILVDDVLTTGATLNAAAEALVLAGATHISAFTLAHG